MQILGAQLRSTEPETPGNKKELARNGEPAIYLTSIVSARTADLNKKGRTCLRTQEEKWEGLGARQLSKSLLCGWCAVSRCSCATRRAWESGWDRERQGLKARKGTWPLLCRKYEATESFIEEMVC